MTGLLAAGTPLPADGTQIQEPQIYLYNCGPKSCWVESHPSSDHSPGGLIFSRTQGVGSPTWILHYQEDDPISFELRAGDTALLRPANPKANYFRVFRVARNPWRSWEDEVGRQALTFQYHVINRKAPPPALVQIKPVNPPFATEGWLDFKLGRKATVMVLAIEDPGRQAQVPPQMLADDKALF